MLQPQPTARASGRGQRAHAAHSRRGRPSTTARHRSTTWQPPAGLQEGRAGVDILDPPAQQSHQQPHATRVSLQQYDDCELLFLEHRARLSVSKAAALQVLQGVQQGHLPYDAEQLRERAQAFAGLARQYRGLDALRVLNALPVAALVHNPRHVAGALHVLLQLLPGSRPTQLLMDVLADLDLPPEILALQVQEADATFRAALGCQVPSSAVHHLLRRYKHATRAQATTAAQERQQQDRQEEQQQQVQQQDGEGSAAALPEPSSAPASPQLREQLLALHDLLGPELTHTVVTHSPGVLDVPPDRVLASLQWLQQQLQLSPVAALLLAQAEGALLLLAPGVLATRYSNLLYLAAQLLGWRRQQVHTLLCNAPGLLLLPSARLASSWQAVQGLARRRAGWLEELSGAGQGLLAAVLGAQQLQLQQLRYAAEARELQGRGVGQVLRMPYVDFLEACPGFRVWRGMGRQQQQKQQPQGRAPRWSLVEEGCVVVARLHDAGEVEGDGAPQGQRGRRGTVLAADERGQPVLIQLGALGPHDRLVA